MNATVIDASVMGPLLVPDERDSEHSSLVGLLESGTVIVPGHWHLEVASLGRSAVLRKRLDRDSYIGGLDALGGYLITVDPLTASNAWTQSLRLALRHQLTPYDAAYLELAIRLGSPLLCDDIALANAASAEGVKLL